LTSSWQTMSHTVHEFRRWRLSKKRFETLRRQFSLDFSANDADLNMYAIYYISWHLQSDPLFLYFRRPFFSPLFFFWSINYIVWHLILFRGWVPPPRYRDSFFDVSRSHRHLLYRFFVIFFQSFSTKFQGNDGKMMPYYRFLGKCVLFFIFSVPPFCVCVCVCDITGRGSKSFQN
jgi:hypothetical protein